MAFLEHPDMPHRIFGIDGFNLWNVLMLNVIGGWLNWRSATGITGDMPPKLRWAFFLFILVICWAFARAVIDPTEYYDLGRARMTIDCLINPLKFLIPCFLFYEGCRTREQISWALVSIIGLYFLLSLEVFRYVGVPLAISGQELSRRAFKAIQHSVGYNRVDMSMMLAGASWAMVAFSQIVNLKSIRFACWGAAALVMVAQASTGGRTGYVTWALVGLVLCLMKWRKALPVVPVLAIAVLFLFPDVRERMLMGFGVDTGAMKEEIDTSEITSGRIVIWPYVIDKIEQAPLIGYGRLAMVRTGVADFIRDVLKDDFNHPHNAYLELLFDNGILGFICVVPIYLSVFQRSRRLFVNRGDELVQAAGGVALALLLALLFGAIGAQTFYPREGVVGLWAAIGVMLRVSRDLELYPPTDGHDAGGDAKAIGSEPISDANVRGVVYNS